jgi:ADP-heptose:LPS heptosyltransferase
MRGIRAKQYDVAIACGSYSPTLEKYACATKAARQIGFRPAKRKNVRYTDPVDDPGLAEHEVVKTWRLLGPLGIAAEPGASSLVPGPQAVAAFREFLAARLTRSGKPLLAIAISARVEKHRWPLEKFAALIEQVVAAGRFEVMILWAPGKRDNPTFPGDDEAAATLTRQFGERILAYPAKHLKETIAALSASDMVVTLDTGSLHMAAALGKPTIALMRESNVPLWRPWQVPQVLVTTDGNVAEIEVAEIVAAINSLVAG